MGLQEVLEYELSLVLLFKHRTVMVRGGVEVYLHQLLTSHYLDLTVPLPPLPVVQGEEWAPDSVMMRWRR